MLYANVTKYLKLSFAISQTFLRDIAIPQGIIAFSLEIEPFLGRISPRSEKRVEGVR